MPRSETTLPNWAFANTFTHGKGGISAVVVVMMYSLASLLKPPMPLLSNKSLRRGNELRVAANSIGTAPLTSVRRAPYTCKRGTRCCAAGLRLICSAKLPWLSSIITRATVCSRMRSSWEICSPVRMKTPPGRSITCASMPLATSPMI